MRIASFFTVASLVAACGGGGSSSDKPDASTAGNGFQKPTAPLMANREVSSNNWEQIEAADLSCLGTAPNDPPTSVAVELKTTVEDFQSGNPVPGAEVVAFRGQDVNDVLDTATADGNAEVILSIPVGVARFGYKMSASSALDTLLLNQTIAPDQAMQTVGAIRSVSKTTATTLSAFIGVSRTNGTGVLAGAMRDCQDREVSNFTATVSTTSSKGTNAPPSFASGAATYYFSPTTGLPARHTQQPHSSGNGLFMVIELEPATTAYVQVWGYKTQADVDADNLELVAELQTTVIADTVITGAYEPIRQ